MKTSLILITVTCVVGAGAAYVAHMMPIWHTRDLVAHEAKKFDAAARADREHPPAHDVWGNALRYSRDVSPDIILVVVQSAGRDGHFDTGDDIGVMVRDVNKSRIAGRWAAKKLKEAAGGFKEGLKDASPFKSDETDEKEKEN